MNFTVQFYSEFTESVRAGATAIFDGHIAPINPMDPEKTQVFVYNNIFYSRAVDTKENFKVRTFITIETKLKLLEILILVLALDFFYFNILKSFLFFQTLLKFHISGMQKIIWSPIQIHYIIFDFKMFWFLIFICQMKALKFIYFSYHFNIILGLKFLYFYII